MSLDISTKFRFGTSTGNDLSHMEKETSLIRDTPELRISSSMFLERDHDYGEQINLDERVSQKIVPGYAYLGDREIYIYNNKITEVLYPQQDEKGYYVDLIGRPDGMLPLYYEDMEKGAANSHIQYGSAPILVQMYNSGDMDSYYICTNTKISSKTGIDNEMGYSYTLDWYLPNRDELSEIWFNLADHGVGDLEPAYYWSSSQFGTSTTHGVVRSMASGTQLPASKDGQFRIRPIRDFIDSSGAYQLRDIGPENGWIFYIKDNQDGTETYYEAAEEDYTDGETVIFVWSNITDQSVSTSHTIGNGKNNTLSIIKQDGHTDSAAYRCATYVIAIGEIDHPFLFSPLEQTAKSPEYWRETNILPHHLYHYDIPRNRIYFYGDMEGKEFVVNYEEENEPFEIKLNISPLFSIPESRILVMNKTGQIDEPVGRIEISTDGNIENGFFEVKAEVFSTTGNRLPNREIDIFVKRASLNINQDTPIHQPILYNDQYCIDALTIHQSILYEEDVFLANDHRIDGKAYIAGAGYMCFGIPQPIEECYNKITVTTDNDGIATGFYRPPTILRNTKIDIVGHSSEEGIFGNKRVNLNSNNTIRYANKDYRNNINFKIVSIQSFPDIPTNMIVIKIPPDCISPSSLLSQNARNVLHNIADYNREYDKDMQNPIFVVPYEDELYAGFSTKTGIIANNTQVKQMLIYNSWRDSVQLYNRARYPSG